MLEKELGELKKYVNMDNYTGKYDRRLKTMTISRVLMSKLFWIFSICIKYLNEINTGHNEILKENIRDCLTTVILVFLDTDLGK